MPVSMNISGFNPETWIGLLEVSGLVTYPYPKMPQDARQSSHHDNDPALNLPP